MTETDPAGADSAHAFAFPSITGEGQIDLGDFAGRPVLIVNTASQCGYTPQYAGLQKLHEEMKDRGLVVLGVPSNDFGEQEPGHEDEIAEFCQISFGVTFPMTGKQKVIGGDAHPFYRWLEASVGEAASPRWNFHKVLIDGDGQPAGIWASGTAPGDAAIRDAIEPLLKA